jgi:hypothetical protein
MSKETSNGGESVSRPREPGRPIGSVEGAPRHDDRAEVEIGLYPADIKRLDLIAQVRGCSRSEAVRWAIERAHYHIAV